MEPMIATRRAIINNRKRVLFDLNATLTPPSNTTVSNATKRIFTPNTKCYGPSWSNYFRANRITAYNVYGKRVEIQSTEGYGVGFAFEVKEGQKYRFVYRAITESAESRVIFYKSDGETIVYGNIEINGITFTVPNDAVVMVIILERKYNAGAGDPATFSGIQLWQM